IQKHVAAAERERLDALGYKKRDIPNEPCLYKIGDVPNSHSVSDFPQPPPVEVNNAKETI
ncbi:MAG: hypothetical protein LBP87_00015, partial [Planctomycetaceae bacterium]|nr:hypothetical protein [Planctomycetaceae bacterium]